MFTNEKARYYIEHRMKDSDSFNFECKGCGNCCNREHVGDIPLTGVDIYHVAKELGYKNTFPVLVDYCQAPYPGDTIKVPVRLLAFDDGTGRCKLLSKSGKCSAHTEKPTVYALYPLGRMYVLHKSSKKSEFVYFAPPQPEDLPCSNSSKRQTLRQWKDAFSIEIRDEETEMWIVLSQKISTLITEYDLYSSGIVEQAFTLFDILLYVYDTAEGIMPQIKRRVKDMDALYEELEEIKLK